MLRGLASEKRRLSGFLLLAHFAYLLHEICPKWASETQDFKIVATMTGRLPNTDPMTETRPIRKGEEIDVDRLRAYLEVELGTHGAIEIEQFPGGSSNLTYLIKLRRTMSVPGTTVTGDFEDANKDATRCTSPRVSKGDTLNADSGTHADSTQEYVLRRPPFGNTVKSAHDMRREFEVLSKLSAVYEPAPKPLLFCDNDAVIGSEFYLMERRHGLIIRGRIPGTHREPAVAGGELTTHVACRPLTQAVLTDRGTHAVSSPHVSKGTDANEATIGSGTQANCESPRVSKGDTSSSDSGTHSVASIDLQTDQQARRKVCRAFIDNLAKLHTLDYKAAGLETLGRIDGYNRRQVEGWTKRYFAAKTHDHDALEKTIVWLNANIPAESGASLVHNDYKFDNVMLDPEDLGRITAVLDWEMVTIGDPLMDLGTTLGYWMSWDAGEEMLNMPFNPRVLMENISREELVEMYAESLGRTVPDMLFYYTFGTFKIAVIAQQIYARYVRGFTKDERFAGFDKFVAALGHIAERRKHDR